MSRSWRVVLVCVVLALGGVPAVAASPLDFDRRVSAQRAIEEVYWRHRIWPSENPGPKPSLSEVLPEAALRARVEDYLLESQALERLWGRAIRNEELQAEVERMVASSRAPEVLEEIFAALGHDPILVAECLARPLLADRLIRETYARDPRYHGDLKRRIERSLARHPSFAERKSLGGRYAEALWMLGGARPGGVGREAGGRTIRMDLESWRERLSRLGSSGGLQEDDENFFVQAVLEKDSTRIRVATVGWPKTSFDAWWAGTKGSLAILGIDSSDSAASLPVTTAACTPDTWTPVQSTGAPSPREAFSAVWTGTEMIVWGGFNGTSQLDTNTGGRYTPATDSWTTTSTTNAPVARDTHTAVWTGTKMVVWGGGNEVFVPKDTGGRYDPTANSWLATTTSGAGAPSAREYHTAVWSGSRMIVWGGWDGAKDIDTGALYDPTGDGWVATVKTGAPLARDGHTAVWSGTRMVVWGGEDNNAVALNTGARFDPAGNAWSATSTPTAPAARWFHSAVWSGSRMIVWGGYDGTADTNTGGVYDPSTDGWTPTSTTGAPVARDQHVSVWTDSLSEMDVWGGQDDAVVQLSSGGRYNPTTGLWTATSTLGTPVSGRYLAAVWTGSEMIVWGGWNMVDLNTGGRYCSGACATPPPAGTSALSVSEQVGGELVSWTAVPGAAAYDVVRGSLGQLLGSGGDFTIATQVCLVNDKTATSYVDPTLPAAGNGFWYLVRGVSCSGTGTYDSIGGSQVGSRDPEINVSAFSCP